MIIIAGVFTLFILVFVIMITFWGTEYYVKYENVKVYELNHEKCAIVSLPASGSIIIGSEGYFTEGSNIKIVQEK